MYFSLGHSPFGEKKSNYKCENANEGDCYV